MSDSFFHQDEVSAKSGQLQVHLVVAPQGTVLIVNLLVGSKQCPADGAPPTLLMPAISLWRTTLSDSRPVLLVARVLPIDGVNEDALRQMHEAIGPQFLFDTPPKNPYIEVSQFVRSSDGFNVLLIFPLGDRAVRIVTAQPDVEGVHMRLEASPTALEIAAPNGPSWHVWHLLGLRRSLNFGRACGCRCLRAS